MRIAFSDKVNKLSRMVKPYLLRDGLKSSIADDAPDNIKKAYQEYKALIKSEYEAATEY